MLTLIFNLMMFVQQLPDGIVFVFIKRKINRFKFEKKNFHIIISPGILRFHNKSAGYALFLQHDERLFV